MAKRMRCECSDPGCPCCKGRCGACANYVVFRVDMQDETGTPMCEGCGQDALDSGPFAIREDDQYIAPHVIDGDETLDLSQLDDPGQPYWSAAPDGWDHV